MTTTLTYWPLLALFVRTPLCFRLSVLDPDSVPCACLARVPILLEADLHQVWQILILDVSSLSTLRPSVQFFFKASRCLRSPDAAWVLAHPLFQSVVVWTVAVSVTVLALPEATPEVYARRSTLHISSLPVVSPQMLSLYNSALFKINLIYFCIQHVLERKCSFAWLRLPTTSAPMLFDRDPIPLNLYLDETLQFFQSLFCIS